MTENARVVELAGALYQILEPEEPELRAKAIAGAAAMLGDGLLNGMLEPGGGSGANGTNGGATLAGLGPAASRWVRSSGLDEEAIESLFHFEEEVVEYIGDELPGSNQKEQTKYAYLIVGVCSLLASDEASVSDQAARDLCQKYGCHNASNHALYVRGIGGSMRGDKKNGFKLTNPGLKDCGQALLAIVKD